MKKLRSTIVFNHEYHLKNILNLDGYRFIQINNKTKYPLLETLNPLAIFFKKGIYKYRLRKELKNIDEITIFGCQDYFSWYLYRKAKKKGLRIKIIADNIEFFLRPNKNETVSLGFKKIVKIFLFGLYFLKLNKDYGFFQNRLIFNVEKQDLDISKSFFSNLAKQNKKKTNKNIIIFISQPYYIDYSIDLNLWAECVLKFLLEHKEKGNEVFIKYHQRDLLKFKEIMTINGLSELEDITQSPAIYIGLFSTYLFELSIENYVVLSYFNNFSHLFPKDYTIFAKRISSSLNLNLHGKKAWDLSNNKMEILYDLLDDF